MYPNPTGNPPQYGQPMDTIQQEQYPLQQPPVGMFQPPVQMAQGQPPVGKPLPQPPMMINAQPMMATQVTSTTMEQKGSFYGFGQQSVDIAVVPQPMMQNQPVMTVKPLPQPMAMNPVVVPQPMVIPQLIAYPSMNQPMMVTNSPMTVNPNVVYPQQPFIPSVNPSDLKNIDDYDLLNNNLKSCRFADGETMLMFLTKLIIECAFFPGIGTFLCINFRKRREVKEMMFGNRMLRYKSRGNYKLALLYFVDAILIVFTFGLWYILGKSHEFFWSHIDERIYWGKPVQMKKRKKATFQDFLVWEPVCEGNGMGTMKIYSVYLGVVDELIYLILKFVSTSTFGLFQPFVDSFYYPKYFAKVDLGVGRFCVIHPQMVPAINEHAKKKKLKKAPPPEVPLDIYPSPYPVYGYPHRPEHDLYKLRLNFDTKGGKMCKLISYHMCERTITCMTCTLFQVTGLNELYQHHFRNKFIRMYVEKCVIEQPPPIYYTQANVATVNSTTVVTVNSQI